MAGPSVALCGAGMIAGVHAVAARELGMPIISVASRTRERAAELAGRVRARPVAYDALPGGADVVIVSTPPGRHATDALRALEAGASVLVEKPLCRTLEEADLLVDAAAGHAERLLYAENLAYAPVVQEMVRRVADLGPLTTLEVRSLQGLPSWGAFTTDEWGGGALFDLGVHPLAVAMLLARPATVVGVQASLRGGAGHGTDEHAELELSFSNGLRGRVVSSWQAGPQPLWDAQAASTTAVLRAEMLPEPSLERDGEPLALPATTSSVAAIEQYGYLAQLRALVDDSSMGRRPLMDAAFGREVLDVVCAAYASAGRGSSLVTVPFAGPRSLSPLELWRTADHGTWC